MRRAAARLFAALAFAALALTGSGCLFFLAGAAAGAGTVVFVKGKLAKSHDASMDEVWSAVRAASRDLGFAVEEDTKGLTAAKLVARTEDKKPVHIDAERTGERTTKLEVRVGVMGDRDAAEVVMAAIDKRLGR